MSRRPDVPDEVAVFVVEEFASRAARDVAFDEMSAFSIARFVDEEPSLGAKWLREHGERPDVEDKLWRASDAARVTDRANKARYKKTAKGLATYERQKARQRRKTAVRRYQADYRARNKAEEARKARVRKRLRLGWPLEEALAAPVQSTRRAA